MKGFLGLSNIKSSLCAHVYFYLLLLKTQTISTMDVNIARTPKKLCAIFCFPCNFLLTYISYIELGFGCRCRNHHHNHSHMVQLRNMQIIIQVIQIQGLSKNSLLKKLQKQKQKQKSSPSEHFTRTSTKSSPVFLMLRNMQIKTLRCNPLTASHYLLLFWLWLWGGQWKIPHSPSLLQRVRCAQLLKSYHVVMAMI
jgi:hypothetical protein